MTGTAGFALHQRRSTQNRPYLTIFPWHVQGCEALPIKPYESYSKIILNQESWSCNGSGGRSASRKLHFWNRKQEKRSHNTGKNCSTGGINYRNDEWVIWNSYKESQITMPTAWLIFTILYLQQRFTAVFLQQEFLDLILSLLEQIPLVEVIWFCQLRSHVLWATNKSSFSSRWTLNKSVGV